MYITHLSISGFRGIANSLELQLAPRTIFYGPNGCGKTSILQSIAWALYGKLQNFSGGVFTREDALVNDFLEDGKAEVGITFSDNKTVTRHRTKQDSTTKAIKPPTLSFQSQNPQEALEKILGLSFEEFYSAVFLHQEVIRDFLFSSPENRSAAIDRMIGTSLIRALIKQVDPKIPNKAIETAQGKIVFIENTISQASVINREMIDEKKAQYGDPKTIPQVLTRALNKLSPILTEMEMVVPDATLDQLNASLSAARLTQLEQVSTLTKESGAWRKLQERLLNAAETNWQNVRQQKSQFGDPSELPALLKANQKRLEIMGEHLGLAKPGNSLAELERYLNLSRQSQTTYVRQLSQKIAALDALKIKHQQAAITDWQGLNQKKVSIGDPATLPPLLLEIQQSLIPCLRLLNLPTASTDLPTLEASLTKARQVTPGIVSNLERQAGELLAMKESYLQASSEVMDEVVVPQELTTRMSDLKKQFNAISVELPILTRRRDELDAKNQQADQTRVQLQKLPILKEEIENLRQQLSSLEKSRKQGELYNQIIDVNRYYIEETQPDHCPVCLQSITNLGDLVQRLRGETPADVAQISREYEILSTQLSQKQVNEKELVNQENQLARLTEEIDKFPTDLDEQITKKQEQSNQLAKEISGTQIEISQIEARIQQAAEKRNKLESVVKKIEAALEKLAGSNLSEELDRAVTLAREKASSISSIDFQPISGQIDRAKKLLEMEEEEKRLNEQLNNVLAQVRSTLGLTSDDNIPDGFEKGTKSLQAQINVIQSLDFEPVTNDLVRANQLQQIQNEEDRLRLHLETVQSEIRQALKLPSEEADLNSALENAVLKTQDRVNQINNIDLQPIVIELQLAEQLNGILIDENKLREMESNNQIANREKSRLTHQIMRLTELREALMDIAETTKQHQNAIVTGVLNTLDINKYYQQLDPHPAYTNLQIEPELTNRGTYNYWIKALTDDYSHGTYVQTRFSTAQANCAAIAIFLAVNQHLSKTLETVILDDPSQSMDPDHQQRLAQTLANNPRQVLIATEDPQLFTFLKQYFISPTIYELSSWTIEGSKIITSS